MAAMPVPTWTRYGFSPAFSNGSGRGQRLAQVERADQVRLFEERERPS